MAQVYRGLAPSNVSRDAKYAVTVGREVRLIYRTSVREQYLLTTRDHDQLVDKVNAVKMEVNGQPGGTFYINEFRDVLVPAIDGRCYWADSYDGLLEFTFDDGTIIGPVAAADVRPGDVWKGPHVGIRYVLAATGDDVYYKIVEGRRQEKITLSDVRGVDVARALAQRLARVKGSNGGRVYINERGEFFAPVNDGYTSPFLYLGNLDEDVWFAPSDGYERP